MQFWKGVDRSLLIYFDKKIFIKMYYFPQINETILYIFMEDTETHHISVMPFRGRSQTTFIRGGEQVVQKC